MNIGKLNKRIKIYKLADTRNDYGELTGEKELVRECWAAVRNKSGTEQFKASTPFSKTVTSFLIRYTHKPINTAMIVLFNGEEYNIVYVDNYNYSNQFIEITAEKVA